MIRLRFTKDYQIQYQINEREDEFDAANETSIQLNLNKHWRGILGLSDDHREVQIITQKFAHSPVPTEHLIDLHSIAFSLIYLTKRQADGTLTEADVKVLPLCDEIKSLHTWPHANYSPIAFATEFVESLTESIIDETSFGSIQRAWILPIMHLITLGRPGHMSQGQFLFPFYRALKSPIPFLNVAAFTEAAGRKALAQIRREKKESVLPTDTRIVTLLKEASSKSPWEPTDANALGDQMSSILYYLIEYMDYIEAPRTKYVPWVTRLKDPSRICKHHLTLPGRRTEALDLVELTKDSRVCSKAQAVKREKSYHVRLELLPELSRKRGCPDNYDFCGKSLPESGTWPQLVKAMEIRDLEITEAEIKDVHAKTMEAGLWTEPSTLTKEQRKSLYQVLNRSPPLGILQRIILFGDVAQKLDAQTLGDDQKENLTTFTTNKAVAMENTGSKLLDFFVAGADTPITPVLTEAWQADPLSALKILFYHRSITEGKGNAKTFFEGAKYVFDHHYRTFLWNLPYLAFALACYEGDDAISVDAKLIHPFGCWKDLLEMLKLWTQSKEDPVPGSDAKEKKPVFTKKAKLAEGDQSRWSVQQTAKRDPAGWKELLTNAYSKDQKLQQYHEIVAFLFAVQLKRDLAILEKYTQEKDPALKKTLRLLMSLAGKWAPTPNRAHDRFTYIATNIARLLYPHMPATNKEEIEKLRWHYRTNCLRPLRIALEIPERLMTLQQYESLQLKKMPSRALQRYSECVSLFSPHLVEQTLKRKCGLNASHVEPHKLVAAASRVLKDGPPRSRKTVKGHPKFEYNPQTGKTLIEAQWTEFVNSLRDIPGLDKCIALCDVSGSMMNEWNAMDWSVAFSLLISELCTGPYKGKIITFETEPRFVDDDVSASIFDRVAEIKRAPWGGSTSLSAAMTLILELAITSRLPPEEMESLTLFIFSDMQFDEAMDDSADAPKVLHEVTQAKYAAEGYKLPRIVYWNMTGSPNQPVTGSTPNTVLLSGTGLGILRSFMCGEELIIDEKETDQKEARVAEDAKSLEKEKTPYDTMIDVLTLPCFQQLAVLD